MRKPIIYSPEVWGGKFGKERDAKKKEQEDAEDIDDMWSGYGYPYYPPIEKDEKE